MEKLLIFDLQRFGDGGGGGAGSGAGSGAAGSAGGEGGTAAAAAQANTPAEQRSLARSRRKENPLANVQYGKQVSTAQPSVAVQQSDAAAEQGQTEAQESFEDLIKGRFKSDFESRVQGIIQDRLRGSREREAKLNPILEMVASRYGIDTSDMANLDLDALSDKIAGDNSQYEQEAMDKGLDVETVAKLHRLERMETQKQREREELAKQTEVQRHLEGMIRQEAEVKKLYPNFDLQAELQNPAFVRLTAPGVGVDVRTAYEVVHRDEMRGAEMQFAAQKSAQRIAASVQANGKRPAENGVSGSVGAVSKSDPSQWNKEDRAEVKRRVLSGEKIYL
jgi:hypothetical protein